MVFGAGVIGAAYSAASSAYTYNMSRFQFDSAQNQEATHQKMNLKIAQWNLFREDVRDLFALTTANLGTYMVVGTLFLGFSITFVYVGLKDFPMEPDWLLLLFGNCVFASLAFGILAVWLAMHGSIAAHAASVKALTQAVRPPIPNQDAVNTVRQSIDKYESAGAATMLRVPNLLGNGASQPQAASASSLAQGPRGMSDQVTQQISFSPPAIEELPVDAVVDGEGNIGGRSATADSHIELYRQLQVSYACFDAYARASLSAAANQILLVCAYFTIGHCMVKIYDKNLTLCKVFVWCTVILCVMTSRILFKLDLYVGKARMRVIKEIFVAGPIVACLAAHLWTEKRSGQKGAIVVENWVIKALVLFASFLHAVWMALMVYEARPDAEHNNLPTSLRSVRHMDVFGWHDDMEDAIPSSVQLGDLLTEGGAGPDERGVRHALRQAKRVSYKIECMLAPKVLQHLPANEEQSLRSELQQLEQNTAALEESMEDEMSLEKSFEGSFSRHSSDEPQCSPDHRDLSMDSSFSKSGRHRRASAPGDSWLQCNYEGDYGQNIPYYVNSRTAEVKWDAPPSGKMVDLPALSAQIAALQSKLESAGSSRRAIAEETHMSSVTSDARVHFAEEVLSEPATTAAQVEMHGLAGQPSRSQSERSLSEGRPGSDQATMGEVFRPMIRRPGSKHSLNSMPWKYFSQIGMAVVFTWVVTLIFECVVDISIHNVAESDGIDSSTENGTGSPTYFAVSRELPVTWPHRFFRPSALACYGETVMLGDSFAVYTADMFANQRSGQGPSAQACKLRTLQLTDGVSKLTPWRSLAILCSGSTCSSLLLLSRDGLEVKQHSLEGYTDATQPTQTWSLSPRLGASLDTITAIPASEAALLCRDPPSGSKDVPEAWGLYAVTAQGEVVSLCAVGGVLEPVHMMSSALKQTGTEQLLGVHVDSAGGLWLLVQDQLQKRAELRSWSPEGHLLEVWQLPAGRVWAPGLCHAGNGQTFVAAASRNTSGFAAQPELWHLMLGPSDAGTSDDLVRHSQIPRVSQETTFTRVV